MDYEVKIRNYEKLLDSVRLQHLESRCFVGLAENAFLFTDTMGDPICRVRSSPLYKVLVAESNKDLVGVIQGSIKIVTMGSPLNDHAIVGYILGLRVSPLHRRKGIGLSLVRKLEAWFISNHVDFAYMATEKGNEASVKLFTKKLEFIRFRTPRILVNPVQRQVLHISPSVKIVKLKIEQAECLYRKFVSSTEFFPHDLDKILKNKLSLGTWVAYSRGETWSKFDSNGSIPTSWAMLSVWNSGDLFKLRVGKSSIPCLLYTKSSRLLDCLFPCFKFPTLLDVADPFGFYFMYGLHSQGPRSGELMGSLCRLVHNIATRSKDCKVVVTEVGGSDTMRHHIPHCRVLSCPEDLWCIKALKREEKNTISILTGNPHPRALFVDPREI